MPIRAASSVYCRSPTQSPRWLGTLTAATRTLKSAWSAWSDLYRDSAAPASVRPASSGCHRVNDHAQVHRSSVRASAMRHVAGRIFARLRLLSRHRLSPGDMPLEAKRFRHVAVAVSIVSIGGLIAVSPRQ
jgi:hypothetical protein